MVFKKTSLVEKLVSDRNLNLGPFSVFMNKFHTRVRLIFKNITFHTLSTYFSQRIILQQRNDKAPGFTIHM